jgi:hypothetical protein
MTMLLNLCPLCQGEPDSHDIHGDRTVWCDNTGCEMRQVELPHVAWQSLPRPSETTLDVAREMEESIMPSGPMRDVAIGAETLKGWAARLKSAALVSVPGEVHVIVNQTGSFVGHYHATRASAEKERQKKYPDCALARRSVIGTPEQECLDCGLKDVALEQKREQLESCETALAEAQKRAEGAQGGSVSVVMFDGECEVSLFALGTDAEEHADNLRTAGEHPTVETHEIIGTPPAQPCFHCSETPADTHICEECYMGLSTELDKAENNASDNAKLIVEAMSIIKPDAQQYDHADLPVLVQRAVDDLRDDCEVLAQRAREATQIIIEEIGAAAEPEDVKHAVTRMVKAFRGPREHEAHDALEAKQLEVSTLRLELAEVAQAGQQAIQAVAMALREKQAECEGLRIKLGERQQPVEKAGPAPPCTACGRPCSGEDHWFGGGDGPYCTNCFKERVDPALLPHLDLGDDDGPTFDRKCIKCDHPIIAGYHLLDTGSAETGPYCHRCVNKLTDEGLESLKRVVEDAGDDAPRGIFLVQATGEAKFVDLSGPSLEYRVGRMEQRVDGILKRIKELEKWAELHGQGAIDAADVCHSVTCRTVDVLDDLKERVEKLEGAAGAAGRADEAP